MNVWVYRLAIAWACFFFIGSVCTSIMGALANVDWYEISTQSRFLIVVSILGNLANTMMAFISKSATKIEAGQSPINGGTDIFKNPNKPQTAVEQKP